MIKKIFCEYKLRIENLKLGIEKYNFSFLISNFKLMLYGKSSHTIKDQYTRAFSLVELLLALGLFVIIFSVVGLFAIDSIRNVKSNRQRFLASVAISEMSSTVEIIARENWQEVFSADLNTSLYPLYSAGSFTLESGFVDNPEVMYYLELDEVYRDTVTGEVVDTGGILDPRSRQIDFTVEWLDILGKVQTITSTAYINDWHTFTWEQTLESEFLNGTTSDSFVVSNVDGEIILASAVFADWCNPQLTLTAYDLPGNGVAKSIYATPGIAHMGTGDNASGLTYANILITDEDPPVVTVPGTFDGYKTNAVVGDDTYAYFATDTNDKEVVILDISSVPYTEIGSTDLPGSQNANAIDVMGNYLFVIQDDAFYSIDISTKTGSRPISDTLTLTGNVIAMTVKGNYAYVLISGVSTNLEIVDISDPLNLLIVGTADISNPVTTTSVTINDAEDMAFIGTNNEASYSEIYFVDISSKTGSRPITNSLDTNGMSVVDLAVTEGDTILIAVGTGATEYQVFELGPSPAQCGGINIDSGLNGIEAETFLDSGNRYSYVISNDSSEELKVIRGGIGGAGGYVGSGYVLEGYFDSEIFDTGVDNPYYYVVRWMEDVPGITNIKFQLRSSDLSDMSDANFIGPDGTANTFFENPDGEEIPMSLSEKRYIQYRAVLESGTADTPVLTDVVIHYQR